MESTTAVQEIGRGITPSVGKSDQQFERQPTEMTSVLAIVLGVLGALIVVGIMFGVLMWQRRKGSTQTGTHSTYGITL